MLDRCANPNCGVPFRHLRGGKVFRMSTDAAADLRITRMPAPGVEYFWLCQACSHAYTLVVSAKGCMETVKLAGHLTNLPPADRIGLHAIGT